MFNFPTTRIIAKRTICAFCGQKSLSHKPNGAAPNTNQTPPPPCSRGRDASPSSGSIRRAAPPPPCSPGRSASSTSGSIRRAAPPPPCSRGRDASSTNGSIRRAAPPPPAPGPGRVTLPPLKYRNGTKPSAPCSRGGRASLPPPLQYKNETKRPGPLLLGPGRVIHKR